MAQVIPVTHRGVRLHVVLHEAVGPLAGGVLLVHGLGEHGGRHDGVVRRLVEAGYEVVVPDLRGHGRSGGRRGSGDLDLFCADLEAVAERIEWRDARGPRFLWGHSLGGTLVLRLLLRGSLEPLAAVASSPSLALATRPSLLRRLVARVLRRVAPSVTVSSGLAAETISRDPAVVAAYRADPLVHDRISVRLGGEILRAGDELIRRAGELRVPVLLMHGDADALTSSDATRAFAEREGPNVTLKLWPGLYHELHHEPERDEVLAFALDWMARVNRDRA